MCNAVYQCYVPASRIGFLTEDDGKGRKHHLSFAEDATACSGVCTNTLNNFLKAKTPAESRLGRRDRLNIAFILASSVLQLDQMPWLQGSWSSDDIFLQLKGSKLVRKSEDTVFPYLSRQLSSSGKHVVRGPEMLVLKAHLIRSDILFALALTLVELCFGKTLPQMRSPEDLDPDGREMITRLNTVRRLLDRYFVDNEIGKWYGDVVWTCLYCPFKVREIDLDDENVLRAVYDEIVMPLANGLATFEGEQLMST